MYEIILNSERKIITWGKIDIVPALKELRIFDRGTTDHEIWYDPDVWKKLILVMSIEDVREIKECKKDVCTATEQL